MGSVPSARSDRAPWKTSCCRKRAVSGPKRRAPVSSVPDQLSKALGAVSVGPLDTFYDGIGRPGKIVASRSPFRAGAGTEIHAPLSQQTTRLLPSRELQNRGFEIVHDVVALAGDKFSSSRVVNPAP
jgi:hypothetical protein